MIELSQNIKEKEVRLFLTGLSYDEIADQLDIAKGSVNNIIEEVMREEYNQVRQHGALGYQPPAPEAILTIATR
jgi:DNA-directed RNA polymerase specialized sigma24 family protein